MKKEDKKVLSGALDRKVRLRIFPELPLITKNDSLQVFENRTSFGWFTVVICLIFPLTFFISIGLFISFFFSLLAYSGSFLWNYKYNLQKKPILIINEKGITHKNRFYQWEHMQDTICAEDYDGEENRYTSTYIKFNYKGSVKTIHISGFSRPVEEVIHYIRSFQKMHAVSSSFDKQ